MAQDRSKRTFATLPGTAAARPIPRSGAAARVRPKQGTVSDRHSPRDAAADVVDRSWNAGDLIRQPAVKEMIRENPRFKKPIETAAKILSEDSDMLRTWSGYRNDARTGRLDLAIKEKNTSEIKIIIDDVSSMNRRFLEIILAEMEKGLMK